MNRRAAFSLVAIAVVGAGVLWVGGMAAAREVSQARDAAAASAVRATTSALPTPPSTPDATPTPIPTDDGWVPADEKLRAREPGDHEITEAQIRASEAGIPATMRADAANTESIIDERVITIDCMWKKGFYYDPRHDPIVDMRHDHDPRNQRPSPDALLAMNGDTAAATPIAGRTRAATASRSTRPATTTTTEKESIR